MGNTSQDKNKLDTKLIIQAILHALNTLLTYLITNSNQ